VRRQCAVVENLGLPSESTRGDVQGEHMGVGTRVDDRVAEDRDIAVDLTERPAEAVSQILR
jgi:hypothetical protein